MQQYFDTLTDVSGNALLGALVVVTQYPSGNPAAIYTTNGTTNPIANNTVVADSTGQISFYAPDGAYTFTYFYQGTPYKTRAPVQLADPMGFVAATDTGLPNAYVVTGQAAYPAQKYAGLKLEIRIGIGNTNTGGSTLAYMGDGGASIVQPGGAALVAGMIQGNGLTRLEWDGSNWELIGTQSQPFYPLTSVESGLSITPTNFSYVPGSVLRYGADPTGAADSAAAFLSAQKVATASGTELLIPGGAYKSTQTLAWGFATLQVTAIGKVTITFTNVGQCITIDGGAGGGGIHAVQVKGYIKVIGNGSTTDAWFVRACHRSLLQLTAADCGCAVRINWCVTTTFQVLCSINESGSFPFQTPQAGIICDQRGAGETTANCLFLKPCLEGITAGNGVGIDCQHTLACTFGPGTSEGNKIGWRQVSQTPQDNYSNLIYGMDFESNSANDVLAAGGGSLTLMGCNLQSSTSNPNLDIFIDNVTVVGGYCRNAQVESAATNAVFIGVQGSNAFTFPSGTGTLFDTIGCQVSNSTRTVTAQVPDQIGKNGTYAPTLVGGTTPGTQTYAANGQIGQYKQIGAAGNGYVKFTVFVNLASNSGGTGTASISLPVAARSGTNLFQTVVIGDYGGITLGAAGRTLALRINPGGSVGQLLETDTGSVNNFIAIGAVSGTANIVVSGEYLI